MPVKTAAPAPVPLQPNTRTAYTVARLATPVKLTQQRAGVQAGVSSRPTESWHTVGAPRCLAPSISDESMTNTQRHIHWQRRRPISPHTAKHIICPAPARSDACDKRPVPLAVTSGSSCLGGRELCQALVVTASAVRTPLCSGGPSCTPKLGVVQEHPRVHNVDGDASPGQVAVVVPPVKIGGLHHGGQGHERSHDEGFALASTTFVRASEQETCPDCDRDLALELEGPVEGIRD
jgi:hypothetical protein